MKKIIKDLGPAGIFNITTVMDRLLFFVLAALSAAGLFFMDELIPSGDIINVSVDNETVYVLSLKEERVVRAEGPLGANIIEVKDGRVRVKEAPCPQKLCVHQGWLDRGAIVCLPNRVVVSVGGDEKHYHEETLDAVTK